MLGNFSFGDYFKEEAIAFAWEFLTKDLGLPQERLVCTYFKGEQGIAGDEAARELWRKVTGFGDDRIRGLGMSDNFWSMGDTGPCGPCSEIYYFNGPRRRSRRVRQEQTPDGIGWIEIWNLVFMQFERKTAGGALEPLPAPSIDTGAGLERLTSVVQGMTSNYDTDLLARRSSSSRREIAGKRYRRQRCAPDDVSMRVIADHARTTAFLIAEGVLPDRTRARVRAPARDAARDPPRAPARASRAVPARGRAEGRRADGRSTTPSSASAGTLIASIAEAEEVRFRQTLERGLELLDERFEALERQNACCPGATRSSSTTPTASRSI